jgi:hypothetical protein
MRTTIDLPDDLYREAKARAALQGRKLKDLVSEYIREGLEKGSETPVRRRSPLPIIRKSASGPVPALTNEEIARILDDEDAEHANRLAGR